MNFLKGRYTRQEIELVQEFVSDYIKGSKIQEKEYSLEGLLIAIRESLREDFIEDDMEESKDSTQVPEIGYYIQVKTMDSSEIYLCRGFDGEYEVTDNPDRVLVFRNKSLQMKSN